jgi:hypothetical protein
MADFVVMGKSKRRTTTPPPAAAAKPEIVMLVTHDQIAKRAYEIWVRKGRPEGQARQHWRQAEAELKATAKA